MANMELTKRAYKDFRKFFKLNRYNEFHDESGYLIRFDSLTDSMKYIEFVNFAEYHDFDIQVYVSGRYVITDMKNNYVIVDSIVTENSKNSFSNKQIARIKVIEKFNNYYNLKYKFNSKHIALYKILK